MNKIVLAQRILKITIIVTFCTLFTQCFYKDYTFKESLDRNFYLMESDILPSKYISIEKDGGSLVLLYDIIEVIGNKNIALVKNTNDKNKTQYNLIKIPIVEYPEDIKVLSAAEYSKLRKQMDYDYSYTQKEGFSREYRFRK
ncbi:hypothetical protein [Flavobacterium hungaricum]|nr:hypothetical protein [Flavobacterium hungaricum]